MDDTGRVPFLTLSLTTDFVAAGRPGGVTATGRIVRQGARIVFAAAELVADDGTLLATASGVFTRAKAPAPRPERTEEIR